MECKKCGAQLRENDKFCSGCGKPVVLNTPNMEPASIDGWGESDSGGTVGSILATSAKPFPLPDSAKTVTATQPELSQIESKPISISLRWETLEVVREWPAKVIHNPSGVAPERINKALLEEIRAREYSINAFGAEINAFFVQNKHYERTCLALSPSKYEHLDGTYLLVQADPEGKDLLLGLNLLRKHAVKDFCNGILADVIHGGVFDSSINWKNKEQVIKLTNTFIDHWAEAVEKLPRDFTVPTFGIGDLLNQKHLSTENLDAENEKLAELEKSNQQSTERHNSALIPMTARQKRATEEVATAMKNAGRLPSWVGWGVFGFFTLISIFVRSGDTFGLGILLGLVFWLIVKLITVTEKKNAIAEQTASSAALEQENKAWAQCQQEYYQNSSKQKSTIAQIQQSISQIETQIKQKTAQGLRRKADDAFQIEDRWFGQRPADPALDRFIQITINLINEIQSRLFPSAPPFKLMEYE